MWFVKVAKKENLNYFFVYAESNDLIEWSEYLEVEFDKISSKEEGFSYTKSNKEL